MRSFIRNLPIARKLTLITMLASGVALLLACISLLAYEQVAARAELVENMTSTVSMLGENSAAALSFNDPGSAEETLKTLQVHTDVVGAIIYEKSGRIFATYRNNANKNSSAMATVPVEPDGYRFGANSLELFHSINLTGEKIGSVYIHSDLRELHERLWRSGAMILAVLILSSLVAYVLSGKLLTLVTEPILHLAGLTRDVAARKDYSIRAVKQSEDELGGLIESFNEMLNQIQARDSALQNARSGLEEDVLRRTAELQQAYAQLERELAQRATIQASLGESEERFRLSFDSSAIGMAIVSLEGRWLKVNPALCQMVGYGEDEMLATDFQSLTHPEDLPQDIAAMRKLISGEVSSFQMEKRYHHKNGRIVWVRLSAAVARGADGTALHFICHIEDIAESKQAAQALADSETRLRELIGNSSDVIAITASDGRLAYVSPSVKKIAGYEPEALLGRPIMERVHPDDRAAAAEQFQELLRQPGATHRIERRYLVHDGSWIDAEIISVNLLHVPAIGGIVSSMRDISERKRAEVELSRTHKLLLDASRQGGMAEVATNVLHNVGNVLNSVNVSASLAVESVKSSRAASLAKVVALLDEHRTDLGNYLVSDAKGQHIPAFLQQISQDWLRQQEFLVKELESLRDNIDHIKGIVAMQQSYSKVSGTTEIVDVRELIDDSVRLNQASLLNHHMKVQREFEKVPLISVEKHKVLQILVNLVRNAVHACDSIDKDNRRVILRIARSGEHISIAVIDNGVGISPENLTRIFAHGFTTRKDGHGFGLHSGALAAREMGGRLSVFSPGLGQGATFTLELPLKPPGASA